jgi:hypothetical protein
MRDRQGGRQRSLPARNAAFMPETVKYAPTRHKRSRRLYSLSRGPCRAALIAGEYASRGATNRIFTVGIPVPDMLELKPVPEQFLAKIY